ncbi:MAG: DUF2155 domain-containing protein [Alphaproteobacteria bacterium]
MRRTVGFGWPICLASILILATVAPGHAGEAVLLGGLDKVTARVSTLTAPIGAAVRFGTLRITARTCHKRPPEEPPESAAFLEIEEVRPGKKPERIFGGWMFASSPALMALEHPVYDVWVIDCKTDTGAASSGAR